MSVYNIRTRYTTQQLKIIFRQGHEAIMYIGKLL